jgi:hypothetical protein
LFTKHPRNDSKQRLGRSSWGSLGLAAARAWQEDLGVQVEVVADSVAEVAQAAVAEDSAVAEVDPAVQAEADSAAEVAKAVRQADSVAVGPSPL